MNRTWVIGGAALVAGASLRGLQMGGILPRLWPDSSQTVDIAVDVVLASAYLVLAIGLRREESVVDRRPEGVVALVTLAVWPFLDGAIAPLIPQMNQETYDAGLDAYRAAETAGTIFWLIGLVVTLVASVGATLSVATSPTVPRRWRWAPITALAFFALTGGTILSFALMVPLIGSLLGVLGTFLPLLFLGILSLVLGLRAPATPAPAPPRVRSQEPSPESRSRDVF